MTKVTTTSGSEVWLCDEAGCSRTVLIASDEAGLWMPTEEDAHFCPVHLSRFMQ